MKDIHSHILYGIDDGAKSLEESIKLLKDLSNVGITDLMLTPHYVNNSKYMCNNQKKEEIFNTLKEKVQEENININIYLGNEVYLSNQFIELIENNEIKTLNNSRYLLIEFPMSNIYNNTSEIISNLISKGYTPILAHPERYRIFQRHPDMVVEYLRMGLHLQGNFTSLFGKYGRLPKKILTIMLKNKQISFLGSDTHHDINFSEKKLRKKLLKITKDEQYVEDLLVNNFDKVINNEEIGIIR